MTKILHVLKSFGHPNQPYTTNLIEKLNEASEQVVHEVICSKMFVESKKVKAKTLNSNKALFSFKVFYFVLKSLFLDKHYKTILPDATLKNKFRFFLKWEPLLNQTVSVIHVHHLHVVPHELIHYLKLKPNRLIVSLRGKELVSDTVIKNQKAKFLNKVSNFDLVHVISDFMNQKAITQGVSENKLRLIYRGFDFNLLKTEHIKEPFDIKNKNEIKAICVGRFAWEKGQFYLLDSIFRLKNKGVFVNLDIYGEGSFREFLEYRIHQLDLESQVVLKGHVPSSILKEAYKNYDIAIQPSIYEALSNGLLDVTFHNLPTVVSSNGGMVEIISDGINGISFDICEPMQLDEAIVACLHLNAENLKAHNHKLRHKFSIEKELVEFNDMYKELC